jgi:capsular exopolysaccharide synthesis family protein
MNQVSPVARYLVPLRRWWYVALGVLVAGLIITALMLPEPPGEPTAEQIADPDATFRASHLLIRNEGSPEPVNFELVQLLARQGELTSRVLERMEDQIVTRDVDAVTLETDPDLGTIAVMTTQPTPDLAARLATTYAEELQRIVDDRAAGSLRQASARLDDSLPLLLADIDRIEAELAPLAPLALERRLLEAELELLVTEFATAQSEARSLTARLSSLESQFLTLEAPSPVATDALEGELLRLPASPVPRFAIFGLLSLIAGGSLVFVIDYLDTRLRTRADVEDAFSLPVIAEFAPRSKKSRTADPVPVESDPTGVTAETFRSLRLSVLLAPTWRLTGTAPTGDGPLGLAAPVEDRSAPRVLLVTSPLMGDGKSTTVANMAASFAESGQKVLVVDCDFRRPAVGGLLGAVARPGLRDISDPREPALQTLMVATSIEGVSIIPAGEPGIAPAWFLSEADTFVALARRLADVVIVDTGPITLTSEASALIPSVDAMMLVVRAGRLTRGQARGTMEQLTRLGASMSGIVLIGTHGAKRYDYYTPNTMDQAEEKVPSS